MLRVTRVEFHLVPFPLPPTKTRRNGLKSLPEGQEWHQQQMRQVKFNLFQYSPRIPSKLISAHTLAYTSLGAMIPQEADKTHIEYAWVSCGANSHSDSLAASCRMSSQSDP